MADNEYMQFVTGGVQPQPEQDNEYMQLVQPAPAEDNPYMQHVDSVREDGTTKGPGWLGEIKTPTGKVSTELSIGVNLNGKETLIPSLVPGLTKEEIDYLVGGGKPTKAIMDKAVAHAMPFIKQGKSPFKEQDKKPLLVKFGQMITGSEMMDKPEVEFQPSGEMKVNMPPTADVGIMSDPMTWGAMGAVQGVKTAGTIAQKLIKGAVETGEWATGGATSVPRAAKAGYKGLEKAIQEPLKKEMMESFRMAGKDVPVAVSEVTQHLVPTSVLKPLSEITPNIAPDTKAYVADKGGVIYLEQRNGQYHLMHNEINGTPHEVVTSNLHPTSDLKLAKKNLNTYLKGTDYKVAPNVLKVQIDTPTPPASAATPQGQPIPQGQPLPQAPDLTAPNSATPPTVEDLLSSNDPVAATYRWQEEEIKKLRRTSTDYWDSLTRALVDVAEPAKKVIRKLGPYGKQAEMRRDLIVHAPTSAGQIFKDVSPQIYDGLNVGESKLLDQIIQSRRVVEIETYKLGMSHPTAPQFRGPQGTQSIGGAEHFARLAKVDQLPQPLRDSLMQRSDRYFQTMKEQIVDPLYQEGLLSDESYLALQSHIYEPRRFYEHIDPGYQSGSGKHITSPDSGIKRLDEGSMAAMETDSQLLLADALSRTQGRIFTNRANQALGKIAAYNPDNGVVRYLNPHQNPRSGYQTITFMENGAQQRLEMPKKIYDSWVVTDPLMNRGTVELFSWLSGSKILKGMATGYNPVFALRNLPRDAVHVLMTTNEYSSFLPKAALQLGKDYLETARDAWQIEKVMGKYERTGEIYKQYQREGGMGDYLTHQGGGGEVGGHLEGLRKLLGYIGESSEIWTRLSLRNRALKNGATSSEATWAANNYLDFSQGGNMAKAADSVMPYLNASIQGTRGLFRAAKRDPATFAWKTAQLMSLSAYLYHANFTVNPEAMKNMSPRERINNFIFTTPSSFIDKEGNIRYNYFKVAKDQSQRAICSLIEALMARHYEGKTPTEDVWTALGDIIPITGEGLLPPTLQAYLTYSLNKDFWTNSDVWQDDKEIYPYLEYTKNTNPVWVKMGDVSKDLLGNEHSISPVKSERAFQKIFTFGNPFTDIVGGGLREMMEGDKTGQAYATINEELVSNATVKSFFNATPGVPKYMRDRIKDQDVADNSAAKIQNRAVNDIVEKKTGDKFALRKAGIEYINSQPRYDRDRLRKRLENSEKLFANKIPNISYWLDMTELKPRSRAVLFYADIKETPVEQRQGKIATARKVPGFFAEDFKKEFFGLVGKTKLPLK